MCFLQNVSDSWAGFKCSRDALFPSGLCEISANGAELRNDDAAA